MISYRALILEKPKIKFFSQVKYGKDLFNYLKKFTQNKNILLTTVIQNPFGETKNLGEIEKFFGKRINQNIKILNKLHRQDGRILKSKNNDLRFLILIFLANYKFLLDNHQKISKNKLEYALRLLGKIETENISRDLEDILFKAFNPKLYHSYERLVRKTQKASEKDAHKLKNQIQAMLKKEGIKAEFQLRFKTITSFYRKMTFKNILHSQVLDTIGFRIIVGTKKECYQVMEKILKNWTVLANKIKDYIAIPKENGYQSIHITIIHHNVPVEIQIRTKKMHHDCLYGRAAHRIYKKGNNGQ